MLLRTLFAAILAATLSLAAIAQTTAAIATKTQPELPTVSNRDEASKQIGNTVAVKGKYAAFVLPNMKGMKRCAKIILSDNSQILLETGKKAQRKKSEYKKMMGKEVTLNGKLYEKVPLDFKNTPRLVGGLVLRDIKIKSP